MLLAFSDGASRRSQASLPQNGLAIQFKSDAGVAQTSGNITTWTDQIGGMVVTASGTGPAPALISNSLNGLPVVRFNNTNGNGRTCYFIGPSFDISSWSGMTVLFLIRTSASGSLTTTYQGICNFQGGVRWDFNASNIADGAGVGSTGTNAGVNLGTYNPPLTNSQVVVQAYRYDKTSWTMSGQFSGTAADTSFPTFITMAIGAATYAPNQSTADVVEIVIYNRKLNDSEVAQAQAYLHARAGA